MKPRLLLKSLIATAAIASAMPAVAHVTIDNAETKGGPFKARFNVPHGCEGSPTTAIKITIPEGVIGVKPMPKPGWQLETKRGAYAKTYDYFHGMKVSEGVKEVIWSGGKLLDEHLDEFVMGMFVTDAFAAGSTIYFPVEQTCTEGTLAWVETPKEGQSSHDLDAPAPGLKVVAKSASPATVEPTFTKDGLTVTTPWARATPDGMSLTAAYLSIRNSGAAADKLIAASFTGAGRVEIHETINDNGVMKMRQLESGAEIGSGATIELKPAGMHLMILDLANPLKDGSTVDGELTFEKAGKIPVKFEIRPLGSSAADSKNPHAHH